MKTILRLRIVPNAKRNEVVGLHGEAIKIKVKAPAVEGKANEALRDFLAGCLGLSAREPSFHVFVSALPEVMIEDDIVRFAEKFAKGRATPPDIVYVHDFDSPEAPKPLILPAASGGTLVAAMDARSTTR